MSMLKNKNVHRKLKISVTQGFTFIEILISLVLLSLLLFGIDATQLTSLRVAESAYYFGAAVNQIQNLASQLPHLNPDTLSLWNYQNAQALPNGIGTFSQNKIIVYWGKHESLSCDHIQLGQSGCIFENI